MCSDSYQPPKIWRPFKKTFSLQERKNGYKTIQQKYPDRIPVIVEPDPRSNLPLIAKCKYLVPIEFTVARFMFEIRTQIKLNADTAIFLFVNNDTLPPAQCLIAQLYDVHKQEDGFLYFTYSGENTFG